MRLVQGQKYAEGYVEMFSDGKWKAVCNNLWNKVSSDVVCLQLGHNKATLTPRGNISAYKGSEIGNEVYKCKESDMRLSNCLFVTRDSCENVPYVACEGMFMNIQLNLGCRNIVIIAGTCI